MSRFFFGAAGFQPAPIRINSRPIERHAALSPEDHPSSDLAWDQSAPSPVRIAIGTTFDITRILDRTQPSFMKHFKLKLFEVITYERLR
jgi:hypothetical protein